MKNLNLQLNIAGMKCSYYSRVYKTARGMCKHLSTYRVQWEIVHCTILRQIQRKTNDFLIIPKAEVILLCAEQMERIYFDKKKEGPDINNIEKMDPVGTAEYTKKADGE